MATGEKYGELGPSLNIQAGQLLQLLETENEEEESDLTEHQEVQRKCEPQSPAEEIHVTPGPGSNTEKRNMSSVKQRLKCLERASWP